MNKEEVLALSNEKIIEITEQLRVAYRMKKTLRYATERDFSVHSESVAEHVFALYFLTEYFLPLEDPNAEMDVLKIQRMILFHDFGEILNGDIPYNAKTEEHEAQEREDAQEVFSLLPKDVGSVGQEHWQEYDAQNSRESKFVNALDKFEPMIELLDPVNETSLRRLHFTLEDHLGPKLRATEEFPVMRRFVEILTERMVKKDLFWKGEE
jgi:5'-deoxynucleotidase YfbR-like HD superfamily hydrolase